MKGKAFVGSVGKYKESLHITLEFMLILWDPEIPLSGYAPKDSDESALKHIRIFISELFAVVGI